MKYLFFGLLVTLISFELLAQNKDSLKVNVYIRCSYCDNSYIRNELKSVNYARDISDANVIVLGMSEQTGSGGEKYRFIFEGKNEFKGMNDTLIFESAQDATTEEIRNLYMHHLKLGLLPYFLKTPLGKKIEFEYPETTTTQTTLSTDPWKGWVISLSTNGSFNGEQSSKSLNIYSNLRIYKITDGWKLTMGASNNYSKSNYSYDEYTYEYVNRSYNSYIQYVLSMSDHWSFGMFTSAGSSTFNNFNLNTSLKPALEYNVFPYKMSFEKQLRISYKIGANYVDYIDTTIFLKTKEILPEQDLSINFGLVKKWGDIDISIYGSQYLHDLELYELGSYINFSVRIIKGLSVGLAAGYSMIRNQINLSKSDVTQEELLLRQRQIKTDYSYWGYLGLSYTIGSKFNNIVNPRFD
ncbi:MAG: hypothetical protein HPY79_07515 [Bacteroidales bacterium]|nr:hypothetical protein [Bacteroidales bacterium]